MATFGAQSDLQQPRFCRGLYEKAAVHFFRLAGRALTVTVSNVLTIKVSSNVGSVRVTDVRERPVGA